MACKRKKRMQLGGSPRFNEFYNWNNNLLNQIEEQVMFPSLIPDNPPESLGELKPTVNTSIPPLHKKRNNGANNLNFNINSFGVANTMSGVTDLLAEISGRVNRRRQNEYIGEWRNNPYSFLGFNDGASDKVRYGYQTGGLIDSTAHKNPDREKLYLESAKIAYAKSLLNPVLKQKYTTQFEDVIKNLPTDVEQRKQYLENKAFSNIYLPEAEVKKTLGNFYNEYINASNYVSELTGANLHGKIEGAGANNFGIRRAFQTIVPNLYDRGKLVKEAVFDPESMTAKIRQLQDGGTIVDPLGQWRNPYQEVIVPTKTGEITMKDVPYPVLGQDETGDSQLMMPNKNYKFRGKYVHETPLMQDGGSIDYNKAYDFLFDEEDEDSNSDDENFKNTAPSESEITSTPRKRRTYLNDNDAIIKNIAPSILSKNIVELFNPTNNNTFIPKNNSENYEKGLNLRTNREAGNFVFNYIQEQHKLPPHVAAGITGNIEQESGFNPNASGDNGSAFGIFQHRLERRNALMKFAQQEGRDPSDIRTQIDFGIKEAYQRGDMQKMLKTKNTEEAAVIWAEYFERPTKKERPYTNRKKYALSYYR